MELTAEAQKLQPARSCLSDRLLVIPPWRCGSPVAALTGETIMWSAFHGKWDVTIDGQPHTIEANIYYIVFYPELNVVIDEKLVYERNTYPSRLLQLLVWIPGKEPGRFEQFGREFVIAKRNVLFSRKLQLFIDGRNAERITEF